MWRERRKALRSWIAVALVVVFLVPVSAMARWHSEVDQLPGMESGGDIAKKAALIGGIGVGALLVVYLVTRKKHDDKASLDSQQPNRLETAWSAPDQELISRAVDRAAAEVLTPPMRLPELPTFRLSAHPVDAGIAPHRSQECSAQSSLR